VGEQRNGTIPKLEAWREVGSSLEKNFVWPCSSRPDIGIPEPILLQHFSMGLDEESTKFLDTSSGGSFSHLTLSEGKDILGKC
jgi:hypothetical protein